MLRRELGVKGRSFVEANHDIDVLAPKMVSIYREVIEKHRLNKQSLKRV
jgi:hypothetical protein